MPRGGARTGAGRPTGAATRRTREIADQAATSGLLPHQILLAVARGEAIGGAVPTLEQRLDAAKAAAPYFAPRLAAVAMSVAEKRSLADYTTEELRALAARYMESEADVLPSGMPN